MTAAERKSLREEFSGKLELEAALAALRRFCHDKSNDLAHRSCATLAILDLKNGGSVQRTLAAFRRDVGIDAPSRRPASANAGARRTTAKRRTAKAA
jgi:hypothetical protein